MLEIIGYKKAYHSIPVLQIPRCQISPGISWFKGENGSGKTTLFKSIAGLIPFKGDILVNKTSLRKRKSYLELVNYADASPRYPSFLTGQDLIDFYLNAMRGNKENTDRMVQDFGMQMFIKQKTGTYSNGMSKKLSLILAFTGSPQWIVLDEPFITLDTEAAEVLKQRITEASSRQVSFCLSSHQEIQFPQPFTTLFVRNHTLEYS